jgi:hypothetical protein
MFSARVVCFCTMVVPIMLICLNSKENSDIYKCCVFNVNILLQRRRYEIVTGRGYSEESQVETDRRFRSAYCLHHHSPNDGSSKHLWNDGLFLPDYTAQHPRR